MTHCKIAFVGAGSYTFGPSILKQTLIENRLGGVELALMDVDRSTVELMAAAGCRTAESHGLATRITATTVRAEALSGADFVVCSVAIEGGKRFATDCEVAGRLIPGHLVSEFGGIAGISYSLRQIAMITELAAQMREHCPGAWLLSVANPLPRVCQAAHESGVKTVGFCSASSGVYGFAWQLLFGEKLTFPWTPARERWTVTMAGLNHFSWLLKMRDRKTGEDVIPLLRKKVESGATTGSPRTERIFLETGFPLLPYDGHCMDFLPPVGTEQSRTQAFHGDAEERRSRLDFLRDVAEGKAKLDSLEHEAWERPIDLVAAMTLGGRAEFNSINLVNDGRIPNLPRMIFVETPGEGTKEGPTVPTLPLPAKCLPYALSAAAVTEAIVRGARERKRDLVHLAVELDPTVLDKKAGVAAIDELLRVHADLLPEYS
jgi:alpha-galactosidase